MSAPAREPDRAVVVHLCAAPPSVAADPENKRVVATFDRRHDVSVYQMPPRVAFDFGLALLRAAATNI